MGLRLSWIEDWQRRAELPARSRDRSRVQAAVQADLSLLGLIAVAAITPSTSYAWERYCYFEYQGPSWRMEARVYTSQREVYNIYLEHTKQLAWDVTHPDGTPDKLTMELVIMEEAAGPIGMDTGYDTDDRYSISSFFSYGQTEDRVKMDEIRVLYTLDRTVKEVLSPFDTDERGLWFQDMDFKQQAAQHGPDANATLTVSFPSADLPQQTLDLNYGDLVTAYRKFEEHVPTVIAGLKEDPFGCDR